MSPIIEARNPALWQDARPDQIWERWKRALDNSVAELFRPDRPRPVVELREQPHRPESGRP